MPKTFITEHDIEDMAKRGETSLEVDDSVVLTDLAYEKAQKLGVRLVTRKPYTPPGAPVRPYISNNSAPSVTQATTPTAFSQSAAPADLHERIRAAVVARLGSQVDSALLDTIIKRVLAGTGMK